MTINHPADVGVLVCERHRRLRKTARRRAATTAEHGLPPEVPR